MFVKLYEFQILIYSLLQILLRMKQIRECFRQKGEYEHRTFISLKRMFCHIERHGKHHTLVPA